MADGKLILDYVYENEARQPERVYMTQPIGGGAVVDYTWGQTLDQARRMAAHLKSLNLPAGARIAILSKNCAHFIMAELAIWMAGGATVAIFPTETAETVRFVLEHSEASLLFVGKLDTWPQQQPGVPAGLPCIALPLAPPTSLDTWDAIVARTAPLGGRPQRAPLDLALITYTSGSTGQPKGVMQCFERITAATVLSVDYVKQLVPNGGKEHRLLSYLPLAHVYERAVVECNSLVDGNIHIFFAEALDTFIQDLNRARPTIFCSVPRLWLKFQQGVFAKMPPKKLDRLLALPLIGHLVRRKVLKGLGLDQVQIAMSASAPIPAELIAWYRKIGLKLLEGYGMTEDFAYSHSSNEKQRAVGYVGVPLPGVEAKLSAEGEILIKSPGQMMGYYKRPDLDADCFTADGFFRTGDKGEWRADGLLKLTGRVKELFKTAKGKYVAPAPVENRLNANPLVEIALVSGVGQVAAFALVVLAEDVRPKVKDPTVRAQVEAEMAQLLKDVNAELPDYERLGMLVLSTEPWTIENGCLTPTMKIKRNRIEEMVAARVEGWYAKGKSVQWA